ncbi:hypothetical protein CYMTET_23312 [Cymbomonas tetramitiformis]|uniref:Uncharacterized protein n=1 Tax=Cymbomonas tetramitiformis TaxID=36881 RepID=A0AAE0L1C3_9CHLO|nr:hypothetical protein CYMTET_23312 [Cymbomonas tetramitiformis]
MGAGQKMQQSSMDMAGACKTTFGLRSLVAIAHCRMNRSEMDKSRTLAVMLLWVTARQEPSAFEFLNSVGFSDSLTALAQSSSTMGRNQRSKFG